MSTYLYLAYGKAPEIKVGISSRPWKRQGELRQQARDEAVRMEEIYAFPNSTRAEVQGIEKRIHAALTEYRVFREWYHFNHPRHLVLELIYNVLKGTDAVDVYYDWEQRWDAFEYICDCINPDCVLPVEKRTDIADLCMDRCGECNGYEEHEQNCNEISEDE